MNELDLVYLAGFIDGEGCFSITSNYPKKIKKHKSKKASILVGGTNEDMINWISLLLNNLGIRHLHRLKPRVKSNWKRLALIQISHLPSTLKLSKLILPHLKLKRPHAILMIEYCERRLYKRRNENIFAHSSSSYDDRENDIELLMKNLNRRGI